MRLQQVSFRDFVTPALLFLLLITAAGAAAIADELEDAAVDVEVMYIAYYGRPADPDGLFYWVDRLLAEGWSVHFVNSFGRSKEYVDRFGHLAARDLVDNLYVQILNRHAEPGGLDWYTNILNTGQRSLAEIAVEIAGGVQNQDIDTLWNKIWVATYFTLGVFETDAPYGAPEIDDAVAIMASVDHTENSVYAAMDLVDGFIDEPSVVPPGVGDDEEACFYEGDTDACCRLCGQGNSQACDMLAAYCRFFGIGCDCPLGPVGPDDPCLMRCNEAYLNCNKWCRGSSGDLSACHRRCESDKLTCERNCGW